MVNIFVLFPVYSLYGATINAQGTISVNAVVPFNMIFADALARNSNVTASNTLVFVGQSIKITTVFSNGETSFKNESFVCNFRGKDGEIKFSYYGKTGENRRGEFDITISNEMIGKNTLQCQATGYEQPVLINQQISLFVLPNINEAIDLWEVNSAL